MRRLSLLRKLSAVLFLALVAWASGAADASPPDAQGTRVAPATVDPCDVPSVEAEPADCAEPNVAAAGSAQRVPVDPGMAFADGLSAAGSLDKLTFPPGNMSAPAIVEVGAAGQSYYGYDFSPDGLTLYGIDNTTSMLVTVDQTNGVPTNVGPMTIHPGHTIWTDLTVHPGTGAAYAASTAGPETTLYRLNLTTGATTEISTDPARTIIDMSMDCAGAMYGTDVLDDSLYRVDPATGALTLVGPVGFNMQFAQGIDFDNATGVLHAWLYQGGGVHQYSSLNLTTGAATAFPGGAPPGEFEGAIRTECPKPPVTKDCSPYAAKVVTLTKKVKAKKKALRQARKSGKPAAIAIAKVKLNKAKKKLKKARAALAACLA